MWPRQLFEEQDQDFHVLFSWLWHWQKLVDLPVEPSERRLESSHIGRNVKNVFPQQMDPHNSMKTDIWMLTFQRLTWTNDAFPPLYWTICSVSTKLAAWPSESIPGRGRERLVAYELKTATASNRTSVTSDVVADTSAEAAPPGNDDPVKDFAIDAARLHGDDWERRLRTIYLTERVRTMTYEDVRSTASPNSVHIRKTLKVP